MFKRFSVSGALFSVFLFVIGCGGGGGSTTTPPPQITIALSGAPQTLAVSATATLTATVSNDSSNAGVDWSCAPATSCGSFNPAHTASGAATTYTAPAAAATVTITAKATASSSATATATITVGSSTQITVAISGAPASLAVNGTAQLTATVTNDSSNAGVDWSCTPANTCGSFNPTHTASGTATTYTAPAAAAAVTVTAASTAQSSVTGTASINVTTGGGGGANLAAGQYAFLVKGTDAGAHSYGIVGSVALDGNGNVTGGEQDYNNGHGTLSPQNQNGDKITGGTYKVGTNGIGTLSLVTNNTALGANGTENFSITVVNSKHVLLTQVDASGTAGGTLDMATLGTGALTDINGNFSFIVAGANSGKAETFGGLIQANGAGGLHVTIDSNEAGTVSKGSNTGVYTAPDAAGRATMSFGGDNFAVYVVGPEVLRLLVVLGSEVDTGTAYGQGAGGFTLGSLSGSFVFKESSALTGANSFVAAGQFATDGNGNFTSGFADTDAAGTVTSNTFAATYTMASNGYGSVTVTGNAALAGNIGLYAVDPKINILDPNNSSGGGGALFQDLGTAVGTGIAVPQATSGQTFTGNYGVDYRCFTPGGVEQNLDGSISVATGGVITGTGDAADLQSGSPHLAVALSGTATADGSHPGRFTLPLTIALGANPPALTFAIYQASTGQLLWVETDTAQYVSGSIEQQQ